MASVRTRNRAAAAALSCALIGAPAIALAATSVPSQASPLLWATVDICNSAAHPNTIGIRGSMPGTGDKHEVMSMQFIVEYRSPTGHWHYLGGAGESKMLAVGNGSAPVRQAGFDFAIARGSTTYTLRGVVVFEWRLNGRSIAEYVRATRAGHAAAVGADPAGYSAATCTIR